MTNQDEGANVSDMTPIERPIHKWTRNYAYGWCRANKHDRIAWLFATKLGRDTLRILRECERERRVPQRLFWPDRPTRYDELKPCGIRERVAIRIAPSLIRRYDHELGAETLRADSGWESLVMLRGAWNDHFRTCPLSPLDASLARHVQEWADAPSDTASARPWESEENHGHQ